MTIDATGLMQPIRCEIDINNGLVQTPMRTQLMRGDAKANRVVVALKNGSENVDLSGVTVTGSFVRPPDEAVIPLNGNASGNEASVTLIDACYAEEGYCEINVMLTVGQTRRTILSLTGYVLKKGSGAVVDVGNVIPSIDDIIAQYAEMQRVTQATQAAGISATTAASNANEKAQAAQSASEAANAGAQAAQTAAGVANAAAGKIDNMTVSATALDTGQPPTAALSEVDGHYLLSLGLPRGATGATPQISFVIATGEPGTDAAVTGITGTAENPVINLTIPRGDTGSIEGLTINGKSPDASGAVTLEAADIGYGDSDVGSSLSQLKNEMVTQPSGEETPGEAPEINAGTFGGMTVAQFVDMIYPVGSIYMSARSTSPASLFGGEWTEINGRFLIGTGAPELNDDGTSPGSYNYAAGSTGGEATHTLTVGEMPSHNHNLHYAGGPEKGPESAISWSSYDTWQKYLGGIETTGGSQPHNNMPPYLAVFIWQRTA